jgi:hypothetical protein
VIALFVLTAVEALEHRSAALEHRGAASALAEGHAGESVDVLAGKTLGQQALIGGEDVDRVVRAAAEGRQ